MPLIEVIANSTKSEKPGWAYVPDTGYDHTKAPLQQPGARKRTARGLDMSEGGLSARQNSIMMKRLAELDKDGIREVTVSLPSYQRTKPKTAIAKRIIESQRSFAHYLADEEAISNPENETSQAKSRAYRPRVTNNATPDVRVENAKDRLISASSITRITDTMQGDGTAESFDHRLLHGEDTLMEVTSPEPPSARLMHALTVASPLKWNDVRVRPSSYGLPSRRFCEICGYWGRIKCLRCGSRLCGLPCKRAHDEDRCQKYGL